MTKKLIAAACIIATCFSSYLTFAKMKSPDEIGRSIAQAYIDSSSFVDESWSKSHPYIAAEHTYFTDRDMVSYKEYKVSCNANPNCGWVIVNLDGDDVSIPIASTEGSANFELLDAKLDAKLDNGNGRGASNGRKLYYFSPFDQAIADDNGHVASLDDGTGADIDYDALVTKIAGAKAKKASGEFKKRKDELDAQGLTSYARTGVLGFLSAYAATNTIPDTFVPGASTSMCGSRIPCYKYNATYTYSG